MKIKNGRITLIMAREIMENLKSSIHNILFKYLKISYKIPLEDLSILIAKENKIIKI
jgi:hypothetical protein